jgi:hypothetical protein
MPRRLLRSSCCFGLLIAVALAAPSQGVSAPAAVSRYAPWVRFHTGEKYWPDDPDAFIARSALTWTNAKDSCSPAPMNARSVPIASLGSVDPVRLGTGGYAVDFCIRRHDVTEEAHLTSTDLTAPSASDPARRPRGVKSGFALDLVDSARHGIRPTSSTTTYDAPGHAPPTYYEYQAHKYIVYWFFFNYNNRLLDKHEGDWEHLTIRLDATDHAVGIAYYAHACKAHEYSWSTMEDKGWLKEGEHPQAYIAIGGHAAWPEDKNHLRACNKGWGDRTSKGRIWRTWTTSGGFADARSRPWYRYGGGWGLGTKAPVGASRHKLGGSVPSGWR